MNSLSSVEAKLPPGFRFHPRDEELICDYLMKWVMGCAATAAAHPLNPLLIEVDLNKCEPWDIPETARVGGKDWYFYSQRDRKYATGLRTNRATISGYWKATGKDRPIIRKGNLVGMRKTLVFYQGRAPKGKKSDWVMHEYRLEGTYGPGPKSFSHVKEDWVLCRVFFKNMSQVRSKFQETGDACEVALSSSPLMEPYNNYNNITFDDHARPGPGDLYNEQVPCFSIFSTNQTSLNFSLLAHMGPPEVLPNIISMPNSGGGGHFGASHNSPSLINNDPVSSSSSSCCDEKVIKAVLSRLTKMESVNDSPSFGEGSTDSYLSHEVELCSIWNEYS